MNLTVAAGIVAAIGDIGRFKSPQKLVSYFGLNMTDKLAFVDHSYITLSACQTLATGNRPGIASSRSCRALSFVSKARWASSTAIFTSLRRAARSSERTCPTRRAATR